jgi:hypothetical protein
MALELCRVSNSKFVTEIGEQSGRKFSNLKCGQRIGRERFQLHLNHCSESKSNKLQKLTLLATIPLTNERSQSRYKYIYFEGRIYENLH